MENYKDITWNAEDLFQCKSALYIIFEEYGEQGLCEAIHKCSFGNLDVNSILMDICPEFVENVRK